MNLLDLLQNLERAFDSRYRELRYLRLHRVHENTEHHSILRPHSEVNFARGLFVGSQAFKF